MKQSFGLNMFECHWNAKTPAVKPIGATSQTEGNYPVAEIQTLSVDRAPASPEGMHESGRNLGGHQMRSILCDRSKSFDVTSEFCVGISYTLKELSDVLAPQFFGAKTHAYQ